MSSTTGNVDSSLTNWFSRAEGVWERFFFRVGPPEIFGFFRIAYGLLLLINVASWWGDLHMWFTDEGVLPRSVGRSILDPQSWSLLYWLPGDPEVVRACHVLFLTHIVLLVLGIMPRINAVASYIWLISFITRNLMLWDAEDNLFRIFGFILIFMPLDHNTYRDWFKVRARGTVRGVPLWTLRLVQIEMTLGYASTAYEKWCGAYWRNGWAMYFVSRLDDLSGRIRLPDWYLSSLPLLRATTWGVLLVETLLPIALWIPRLRGWAIVVGILLHLGIETTMHLFLFQWMMILGLLMFVSAERWSQWLGGKALPHDFSSHTSFPSAKNTGNP